MDTAPPSLTAPEDSQPPAQFYKMPYGLWFYEAAKGLYLPVPT